MKGILTETGLGDLRRPVGNPKGLMLGEVSGQVIEHVIAANRGEYREEPLLGAEVQKRQKGIGERLWCSRARTMCRAAGVAVNRVSIDGETITIE